MATVDPDWRRHVQTVGTTPAIGAELQCFPTQVMAPSVFTVVTPDGRKGRIPVDVYRHIPDGYPPDAEAEWALVLWPGMVRNVQRQRDPRNPQVSYPGYVPVGRNAVSWFPTPGMLYVVQPCTSYEQAMLRLLPGMLIYDVNGWKWGMDSLDSAHISSFEVNDALAYHIVAAHHGVVRITFAGHSASAIMASHYAVAAKAPDDPRLTRINDSRPRIECAFFWSNASHLPWLDGTRPVSLQRIAELLGRELTDAESAGINDYPHGLDKLPRYFDGASAVDLAPRFLGRGCWNCFGENDDRPMTGDQPMTGLGAGAAHIAQGGMSRRRRAEEFQRNAESVARQHGVPCLMRPIMVPDTGHDPLAVFRHRPALEALFGGRVLASPAHLPARAASWHSL